MNFVWANVCVSIFMCALSEVSYGSEDTEAACHCVPRNMCLDNDVSISEGEGLLDSRMNSRNCENDKETCCRDILWSQLPSPTKPKCGMHSLRKSNNRITSESQTAQFGEAAWTVAILLKDSTRNKFVVFKCGGSLIHPHVIMTAAHCVTNIPNTSLLIRVGEWNTRSLDEPLPYQERRVKDIYTHPLFHLASLKNDVSLLIIEGPIELSDNVGIICLPPPTMKLEHVICTASGWGKNNFRKGKYSAVLKIIELPLVTHDTCQRLLMNTRLGRYYHLDRSFICAGGELNKDTCRGDGGSPLVCPIPNYPGRYVQMGIVSWGIGCGESDVPGVYVNVPYVRNWIDRLIISLNFDTAIYSYGDTML